jgi:SAM-dependent methyltransferase
LVYVNPREDQHALIYEGPVLGDYDPEMLISSDVQDIEICWEKLLIEAHIRRAREKRANAQSALQKIEIFLPPPGRLLDVGCFCGIFMEVAAEQGWEVQGVEPLVGPSIYARGALRLDVITDTLRTDSFPPESFDVVTAFQVFEHLPDPASELVKIRSFLKPGGLVVIEVPNVDNIGVKCLGKRHRHFVQDHLYFFSPTTLSLLLDGNGFDPLYSYYPARLMSVDSAMGWVGRITGQAWGKKAQVLVRKLVWADRMLPVNLRDIVCVIGKKR